MATTFEEEYKKYNDRGSAQQINSMYDAQKQSQLNQLESAYNQNKAEAEAARDKLPGEYQARANDLAAQYERNRRNFNMQAASSGINTGTASQAALAQNSEFQRDLGNIRTAEADAIADADRGILNLTTQYQGDVASAMANNDYERAAALLGDYQRAQDRALADAQTLAAYGDFSGYASIYGDAVAQNMSKLWTAQNPDLAYRTGKITADEYRTMTGNYPAGHRKPNYNPGYNYDPVNPLDGEVTNMTDDEFFNIMMNLSSTPTYSDLVQAMNNINTNYNMTKDQAEKLQKAANAVLGDISLNAQRKLQVP